jgi:large subunit ribosomal protein L32
MLQRSRKAAKGLCALGTALKAGRELKRASETKGNFVMPNPKRRHSTRRTALRRSHDFLTAVGVSECPNCHEKKLPHRACPKCGAYKGRAVLDIKEAAK